MTGTLRPHQVVPAARLLDILRSDNAVDLSDTGTGKTYVAAWCAKQLGLPTLAVVPKIAVTAWRRAAAHFGDELSVIGYEALRTGRTPYGSWENNPPPGFRNETWLKCMTCQLPVDLEQFSPCVHHPQGIHCTETKKKAWQYGDFSFSPGIGLLIFDEVHRCSGIKSRNADLLIAARRQTIRTLGLSATAAASPLHFRALGYSLGLHSLNNFYNWARRYGCGKINGIPGFHWLAGADRQKKFMEKLHRDIFPARGIRVRTADIPNFPARTITPKLFDIDQPAKLDALYRDMQVSIDAHKLRAGLDKDPNLPVTLNLRERQLIELLKIPLAVELATDYLAKGCSVGIFCNFSATIAELSARLNCNNIIDGDPKRAAGRQGIIDAQQQDKIRLVILNSEAGGVCVSLHDIRGEFPRVGLVFPPQSARTFIQLTGRFQRDGGLSRADYVVLLAAGTLEENIYCKLNKKIDNLHALNDADFTI